MPNAFDFSASPFDCLVEDEQKLVRDNVDIAFFREGEALLEPGVEPSHLFFIIKGPRSRWSSASRRSCGINSTWSAHEAAVGRCAAAQVVALSPGRPSLRVHV